MLRECEAIERIIGQLFCGDAPDCGDHDCIVMVETLHALACIWSDHSDFDPAWLTD